jgi:hypothetical protein
MKYDTLYRHNQALFPGGLDTLPAALHALNAAVDDCRRAGKSLAADAATLLLIRNLADVADRDAPSVNCLRKRCRLDREAVIAGPALLAIAGNDIAFDRPAKRTFHYQARRALAHLLAAIGLDPDDARISTVIHNDRDEGTSELRHADIAIRVVPRGLVPGLELSFHRCRDGQDAGKVHQAPIAELLDAAAFARRLASTIGPVGAIRLAAAA